MATVNGSIILISLPAIFNGINIDPLTSFQYLLWILMGYGIVTATLLLSFGRLSDIYGRVRLYNIGFAIFTAGSILLFLTPDTGDAGAIELIVFRLIQAVGAAFIFSNSAAILTDAFPPDERGKALGLNSVAALSGQFVGLIIGGILAAFHWRYVFLISVPFGVIGTIWAFMKLKEPAYPKRNQKIDLWGNLSFIGGLTLFLVGITYALLPYGSAPMGWGDPWVIAALVSGFLLLVAFPVIETKVKDPMFRMDLFKIRNFAFGNGAGFLSALARGGVMIILIILLQGVWLPLHGYSFESTPFWAGVYMLPLTIGFVIMGPLSGIISDKYGARWISTLGMVLVGVSFLILALLPYNFDYLPFALALLIMGLGNGMFSSPNAAAIMNSVPADRARCLLRHDVDPDELRFCPLHGDVLYDYCRRTHERVSPRVLGSVVSCQCDAAHPRDERDTPDRCTVRSIPWLQPGPDDPYRTLPGTARHSGACGHNYHHRRGLVPDDTCRGVHALACPLVLYRGRHLLYRRSALCNAG